jgi:hypothetical protein
MLHIRARDCNPHLKSRPGFPLIERRPGQCRRPGQSMAAGANSPRSETETKMIDKTYQPSEVEGRIYATWEAADAFRSGRPERRDAEPYCIVIPPPNVTGSLHLGHALNNTLQDVLARFDARA